MKKEIRQIQSTLKRIGRRYYTAAKDILKKHKLYGEKLFVQIKKYPNSGSSECNKYPTKYVEIGALEGEKYEVEYEINNDEGESKFIQAKFKDDHNLWWSFKYSRSAYFKTITIVPNIFGIKEIVFGYPKGWTIFEDSFTLLNVNRVKIDMGDIELTPFFHQRKMLVSKTSLDLNQAMVRIVFNDLKPEEKSRIISVFPYFL